MADYSGLIQGLSEGLRSGLESYRTERDYQTKKKQEADDRAMRDKMFQAGLVEKGLMADPEKGFIRSADTDKERALDRASKQAGLVKAGFTPEYDATTKDVKLNPIPGWRSPEEKALDREAAKDKRLEQQNSAKAGVELRKEYVNLPTSKASQDVTSAYEKVKKAAENPSAAGDLSLIFGYMKMLDPGSVVREGEFASAQNAAGIPDRIKNAYNKAISGERLSEDQRKDFINQAGNIYNSQAKTQGALSKYYGDLAKRSGVRSEDVVVPFSPEEPPMVGARGLLKDKTMAAPMAPNFKTMSEKELDAYLGSK